MLKKILNDKKKLALVLGAVFIVIFPVIVVLIFTKDRTIAFGSDRERFAYEYNKLNGVKVDDDKSKTYPKVNISSDNVIRYSNALEVLKVLENKENAVIYFGNPKCLYCRSAAEVLCNSVKDTELDKIYYLENLEKDDDYSRLLEILRKDIDFDEDIIQPLVVFVSCGDIVSYWEGTLFSQKDPYTKLDESQVKGLSEIYISGINDVVIKKEQE